MALNAASRVQETTTTSGTGTLSLSGAVSGYQSFVSGVGSGNTCYYTIYDQTAQAWEVGIGTVTAGTPDTLSRDTVLSSSTGSKLNLAGNTAAVWCDYPAEKVVYLDSTGNVTPLGTISSGTWQGTTVGVAYGGTGVTASSGANSVVLRDLNQNTQVNRIAQSRTVTTAAGGTTALTAASSFVQTLTGTGTQTFTLPDATTLPVGTWFLFDNDATSNLVIQNYAAGAIDTIASGGYTLVILEDNSTVAGYWIRAGLIPSEVNWGTNSLDLGGSTVITNGTWNGNPIPYNYGGTTLTTFGGANNALYSTSATALTYGTLPPAAGGTGATAAPTNGQLLIGNGTNYSVATLGSGTGISTTTGAGTLTINNTGVTSLAGTSPVSASASTGSVTISLASGYGDTQNPYASKTANYVLAAPNGSAGVPTFRALVAADIPTLNQNTTGSAASLSISGQTGLLTFTGLLSTNRTKTVRDAADTVLELGGSYTPTGTWNWTSATATWPTFNQNTTGSAASAAALNTTLTTSASTFYVDFAPANGGTAQTIYNNVNLTYVPSTGTLNATQINGNSDERLKTNWRDLPEDFVERMAQVKSGVYDRTDTEMTQAGVSAQSLLQVLECLVSANEEGMLSVAYGNAALVLAIELAKRVVALEAKVG